MHRFDRFMETALYHPERGYYTARIKGIGNRGDFTTTPQLSSSLAKAIAQTFLDSGLTHLIEVGPGTGTLAATVRKHLPILARMRTRQHLVEVSPFLRTQQVSANPKAQHHHSLAEALAQAKGKAFIYSNELVDAFPVRIFRKEKQGFSELFLERTQGHLQEHFLPADELPDSLLFQQDLPSGQRIEVHQSYQHWLEQNLAPFVEGQILTIDYTLPQPLPLTGTLRGYFLQSRLTGGNIYQNAGHIDLTADVFFEDLKHWGQQLGLRSISLTSQADFLSPHTDDSTQDQFLTDPEGAGTAFQVLLQEKKI